MEPRERPPLTQMEKACFYLMQMKFRLSPQMISLSKHRSHRCVQIQQIQPHSIRMVNLFQSRLLLSACTDFGTSIRTTSTLDTISPHCSKPSSIISKPEPKLEP